MTDTLTPPTVAARAEAGMLTGGESLVESLIAQGVDTIFGLPGIQLDGLFVALHDAKDRLRVLHTRHEQATAYMADGYARVTGREGVCVVVPGPGALNAAAGLSTAYSCNSPVLCVTGQIRSDLIGKNRGALHEITDQLGMFRSVTKWQDRPETASDVGGTVEEAFRQLRTGRQRPVAIEVAPDVLTSVGGRIGGADTSRFSFGGDPDLLAKAAKLLGEAKNPVIVAGGGVERSAGAPAELARVAELLEAPVIKTSHGKGALSDRDYRSQNSLLAGEFLPKADVVVILASRFPDPAGWQWYPASGQQVIQIDIDRTEFGKFGPGALNIEADARPALAALAGAIPAHNRKRASRKDELAAIRGAFQTTLEAIDPQAGFGLALRAELPDEGILVGEFTQVGYWCYLGYDVYEPNTFLTPGYQGTLGYGFTTAMGAKVGKPDTPVVSINGDGGFGYTLNELSILVQHNIPLVAVVFNDNAYGNVRRLQSDDYGGRIIASELLNPDYMKLASAFGVAGRRAETPAALRTALREALHANEPCLIEVPIGITPDPWKMLGFE
ncbi:MAG: thiamine pyrophosphate-dependent enzyme [Chloroflexota bacterium]